MNSNTPIDDWNHTLDGLKLGEDEAHVWRATLDQDLPSLSRLFTFLSPDERQRAEKYYRAVDRDHFIAGRGILRKILSSYLSISPDRLEFTYNKYGKPFISNSQNNCDLTFNLSHAHNLALYAITNGRGVGVDIEYIREDFATLEIAENFFSEAEVRALRSLPIEQRTVAFFNCWSRKESYIKALGMGVSYPLDRFTVSLAPGDTPALLHDDNDERELTRWKMYELKPGIGYVAAVIVENPPVFLRRWEWNG